MPSLLHQGQRLALLIAIAAACSPPPSPPTRQVIVVLLDAARADRFGCYGYARATTPELDALAAQGAVFLRNYTQGENTRRALPSLIYSRYFTVPIFPFSSEFALMFPEDLLHGVDDQAVSLPAVFRSAGFLTAGISAHSWTRADTAFAREFDEWHDLAAELGPTSRGAPSAATVVDRTIAWIDAHSERDFFLYVHLMDTHFPHLFGKDARAFLGRDPPPLDRFRDGGFVIDISRMLTPEEDAYLDAIYDGDLRAADRELGRLIDELDRSGVLDDGLIAVTADHGENLLERVNVFEHGGLWYEEQGRIPFLLVGRKRVPVGRHEYLTGVIDLLPTLAGLMGAPMPAGKHADGIDLSPYLGGKRPPRNHIAIEGGIVVGNYKALFTDSTDIVLSDKSSQQVQGFLFDIASDPHEEHDLRVAKPARWAHLVGLYRNCMRAPRERYLQTKNPQAHEIAFALAPWSFRYELPPRRGPLQLDTLLADETLPDGWFANSIWPFLYLVAKGDAGSLRIDLPVPDGDYLVDLHMRGGVGVRFAGELDSRQVVVGPIDQRSPSKTDSVPIGLVHVQDSRFSVVLEKSPDTPPFYLSSIGFTPEHLAGQSAEERERVERLKELGY